MKKLISFIRHSYPEIYKGILLLLAIVTIVYIFPKQGKFKYEFRNLKGKPWYHDDLIAPFNFAILKTDEELNVEKAEILKNAKFYFKYDTSIVSQKKVQFKDEFNSKWDDKRSKELKTKTLELGKRIIDSIYSKGIIEASAAIENKNGDFSIFVLYNNLAEEHDLNYFYTVQTAYDYIKLTLSEHQYKGDGKFLLPLLENSIAHNVFYDKSTTDKVLKQSIEDISPSRDIILKDQSIVSKGEIIDAKKYQILESLKAEYEGQSEGTSSYMYIFIGQIIIVACCIAVLMCFLAFFRNDIFLDNSKITFILILVILQVLMTRIALDIQGFNIYFLPFCILPVIIRAFYDTRIALFVHLITVLVISIMAPNRFEFAFVQSLGGMVAVFSIVNMRNRSQIFISAALIFITYSVSYVGITIIQEGGKDIITRLDFAW
ncbi:MAG TPA: hypothetical protein VFF27_14040, partial [Bacteroidia bacterium]|nr:hypothetical protein [Bacteroidia bacterium]